MKKIIKTLVVLLTFSTTTMAEKGFDVQEEITINVSAEKLWEMVGPGFIEIYKWSSNVDHAEGKGKSEFEGAVCTERFCDVNVKGFSKVSEKLIQYDQNQKVLAYQVIDGMPGFVTKALNQWTVVSLGENKSKLVMKAEFKSKGLMGTLMNGMMRKKMTKTLLTILNDAKVYAETGKPSAIKQKRIAKLAKKKK